MKQSQASHNHTNRHRRQRMKNRRRRKRRSKSLFLSFLRMILVGLTFVVLQHKTSILNSMVDYNTDNVTVTTMNHLSIGTHKSDELATRDEPVDVDANQQNNGTGGAAALMQQMTTSSSKQNNSTRTTTPIYRHSNFSIDFPICLVHIGKAAGSSVSCGLGLTYADCEGMPRDRLPHTHFFHMRHNQCPIRDTQTYIVTLRNPLTRIQSWFDFEKDIVPMRSNMSPSYQEQLRQQRALLFQECYPTFHQFVVEGLQPLPLSKQSNYHMAKNHNDSLYFYTINATDPKDMTCPERAWAAILGARSFSYHEWYNYEHYWTGIRPIKHGFLNASRDGRPAMVALRTEHLSDDWETISREPLFRAVNRNPPVHEKENITKKPKLVLDNPVAIANLCHALCPEIQFYKRFLRASQNLEPRQRLESLSEISVFCPNESSLDLRTCPEIPTFPSIIVSKRQYRTEVKKRLYTIN